MVAGAGQTETAEEKPGSAFQGGRSGVLAVGVDRVPSEEATFAEARILAWEQGRPTEPTYRWAAEVAMWKVEIEGAGELSLPNRVQRLRPRALREHQFRVLGKDRSVQFFVQEQGMGPCAIERAVVPCSEHQTWSGKLVVGLPLSEDPVSRCWGVVLHVLPQGFEGMIVVKAAQAD